MFRCGVVVYLLLLLIGCSSVPFGSMLKLRDFDPLQMRAEALRILVQLPDQVELSQAKVSLLLGFDAEADELDIAETVWFSRLPQQEIPPQFLYADAGTSQTVLMALPSEDAKRLSAVQAEIQALKDQGVEGKGVMRFNVSDFCLAGTTLPSEFLANIYLQLEPGDEFIHVVRDLNLREQGMAASEYQCAASETTE